MKAIIAVNNLGFIGKDNKLFWHSSDDLKHFKQMTTGELRMLVGYNTYQTLPEVVKKRGVTIDVRSALFHPSFPIITENGDWKYIPHVCIGGKKTYEKYCHMFTELHISHINNDEVGDCTFPDLTHLNPACKIFNYYFECD